MATVPRTNERHRANPGLRVWNLQSERPAASDEQLRAQAVDLLRGYSGTEDALGLLPVLERLQMMCRRDLEARTSGRAAGTTEGVGLAPLSRVVKEHVIRIYRSMGCNKTQAARVLEIDIKTLYNKLKRYGLQ